MEVMSRSSSSGFSAVGGDEGGQRCEMYTYGRMHWRVLCHVHFNTINISVKFVRMISLEYFREKIMNKKM